MILDASALIPALGDPLVAERFAREELAAPDLIISETLNAFWKLARTGANVPARSLVLEALDELEILPSRSFAARASQIASILDHSVYDCLYLAVAEARDDVLVTSDRRFVEKIGRRSLRRYVRML